jgi:lysophospholipase L1-like esterase
MARLNARFALGLGAVLIVGALAAEIGVRLAGLVDSPLYDVDATIGSVGRDPRGQGSPDLYRDGIHPTPAGMGALAALIAERVAAPAARE